jgi:hypothetical protein
MLASRGRGRGWGGVGCVNTNDNQKACSALLTFYSFYEIQVHMVHDMVYLRYIVQCLENLFGGSPKIDKIVKYFKLTYKTV